MTKGVIFDMDGVLIDSEPLYRKINSSLFRRFGFSLSDEEYSEFVGTSDKDMWQSLRDRYKLNESMERINTIRREEHVNFFSTVGLKPMKGAVELLDDIKKKGIKLALASSTPEEIVNIVMKRTGMDAYFKIRVCGDQVERSKPEPEIFNIALEKLGISHDEGIIIEDSENGVKAAVRAGIKAIGFQSDDGTQDLSGAFAVIHNLEDVRRFIEI